MTIGDLKEKIKNLDDNIPVRITARIMSEDVSYTIGSLEVIYCSTCANCDDVDKEQFELYTDKIDLTL